MKSVAQWAEALQEGLSLELGQPVALAANGASAAESGPLRSGGVECLALDMPGERVAVCAEQRQLAGLLVAASLIEESAAAPEVVAALWSEILGAVAERLGGQVRPVGLPASPHPETFSLTLGEAKVFLIVSVEPRRPEVPAGDVPAAQGVQGNYDLLLEVELDAMVRFGAREMEFGELLELGAGDVIELDRQVTDPVDLIVGDKIIARGEVVLVNGNFGLRITEVAEPMRRLESIRCAS
jgi:flagellar motor switch protein FliN